MALPHAAKTVNPHQTAQQALDFHRQGRLPQAERLYSEVLAVRPDHFDALHMLGLIKLQRGDLVSALRLVSGALAARPRSPEVLLNYGIVLDALKRTEEALAAFDAVIAFNKRSVEAHNNRGTMLEKLGRDEEALTAFARALSIKPGNIDALYNQGSVLRKLGRYEEALKSFDRALAIKPDHSRAHNNRGTALEELKRLDEALAAYERSIALDRSFVEAHNNRANVLQKLSRYDEAIESYERALALNPAFAEVLNNRGNALAALGRHREALQSVGQAIAVNPNYVNAQWNEALLRLRLGDFCGGFERYECRWKRTHGPKTQRHYPQALWLGQFPVEGKTVLLHHEQGLGDTIQFARYAPLLMERGARVVLEVQPPLKTLMARMVEGITVIGNGEPIPHFDMHCPIMSLPLAFRTTVSTIPARVPYLAASPERIARWRERLPQRSGLRVGLAWSGSTIHAADRDRSIPLAQLAPLLAIPGVTFIGLQKDLRESDALAAATAPQLIDVRQYLDDYDDTAALVAELDVVISVDTSVAHLAGAMAKPVWVLLPLCPDWRWLTERSDSPWYPTARLFRQTRLSDWQGVIAKVARALTQFPG